MTKTFCDVCSTEIISVEKGPEIIKLSTCGKVWDICDDCQKELNLWVINKKNQVDNVDEVGISEMESVK